MFLSRLVLVFALVYSEVEVKIIIFPDSLLIIGLYTHQTLNLSRTSLYTESQTVRFQHNSWKSRKMAYFMTS